MTTSNISEQAAPVFANLQEKIAAYTQEKMSEVEGIHSLVVSSSDGLEIFSHSKSAGFDASSVSAMSSSVNAVAQVMLETGGLHNGRSTVIEGEDGYICLCAAQSQGIQLIICAICLSESALLALVLRKIRELALILDQ